MCGFCLLFFSLFEYGTIGLCTWLADLSFSESSDWDGLELDEVNACMLSCWIGLGGKDTCLSTFFPDLNVWTILHWLNYWSSARWTWVEFLGFANSWLGKVLLGLSLCELASWLIWTSNLVMPCALSFSIVCMGDPWFLIYLFIVFSNQSFFSQVEDFGRKIVEHA